MNSGADAAYIAFDGDRRIATGGLREVARAAKEALDRRKDASVLVFHAGTSGPVELDLRGSAEDVLARLPATAELAVSADDAVAAVPRGPGRPKLGVIAREITLLPRH